MAAPSTLAEALDAALEAYAELTGLAEDVEDEWSYIQDLTTAWQGRLAELRAARGGESPDPALVEAFEAAATEIGAIEDPHRAIDWLSTYPQVLLFAVGEQP